MVLTLLIVGFNETFTRSSLALNMSGKLLLGPEIGRPHKGDLVMNLFVTLGSTINDWGWPKNGSFWTKNGQPWQACQLVKVVQKGPKGTKMVNLSVFDHLGPLLGPSGTFWTILDKNDFVAPNGQSRVWQRCFGAKYQFLFEMV